MKITRPIVIFFLFFILYNLNLVPRPNSDAIPSNLLPFSILINHDLYLDPYYSYYSQKWQDPGSLYFLQPYRDHYISPYPITLPLAVTPLYIPVVYLFGLSDAPPGVVVPYAYVMGKLIAAAIAALSVVAFYQLLLMLFGAGRMTVLLTLAYGLGTSLWSQASQHLLQHGFGCLMIITALLFFLRALRAKERPSTLLVSGLAAALAVAERYNNVFAAGLVAIFVVYRFYKNPSALVAFFSGPIVIGTLLVWYNVHFFHNLTGGYSTDLLGGNMLTGFAGILISPSRGLFVYSPFLLASVAGMVAFFKNREYRAFPLLAGVAVVIVVNILLVARWRPWWGGYSYGPRLLTEIVPLCILFIPFIRESLTKSRLAKLAFGLGIALSIVIHGIGVFCYPKGMSNSLPKDIDKHPARLWEINNSQILAEAGAGLNMEMIDILFRKMSGKATATVAQHALADTAMRAELHPTKVPRRMTAGFSYKIPFAVTNRSGVRWPSLARKDGSCGILLHGFWRMSDGSLLRDNGRTMLWDLLPAARWSDYVVVTAPGQPGTYTLGFDLFQSGKGWFHENGSRAAEQSVVVEVER